MQRVAQACIWAHSPLQLLPTRADWVGDKWLVGWASQVQQEEQDSTLLAAYTCTVGVTQDTASAMRAGASLDA